MLNKCIIAGRLCRDPEIRMTADDTPVASFTLAVERDYRDKGSGEKPVDFLDCVAWRGAAKFAGDYLRKGGLAIVSGRLQIREWTDKDGNKRRSAEILADSVYHGGNAKAEEKPVAGAFKDIAEPDEGLPF